MPDEVNLFCIKSQANKILNQQFTYTLVSDLFTVLKVKGLQFMWILSIIIILETKTRVKGIVSSVVEYLSSMHQALGSNPSSPPQKIKQ